MLIVPEEKAAPRRFVLLDRDGTIIADRHYLSDPAEVELLPGAAAGLRQLRQLGLSLVVVTNQSGVGRGYFSAEQVEQVHGRMRTLLAAEGVWLEGIYFCPHAPEDECGCRKPAPGLIELAARQLGFESAHCFVVGDRACDIELGRRIGATTLLVGARGEEDGEEWAEPDYVVEGLVGVAGIISSLQTETPEVPLDSRRRAR